MGIEINVTPTKVQIADKTNTIINKGEYNVNTCNFTFSQEFDDKFKRAVFNNIDSKKYVVEIKNNSCIIPEEVLKIPGMLYIGVYAYDTVDDKLHLRYSPTPDSIEINEGSYSSNLSEALAPETSLDLIEQVNQSLRRINSIRFEIDELGYLILTYED